MADKITKEQLKKIIFEAFKDVPKGEGIGARECGAMDDYADPEQAAKAKAEDVEKHWWEYPEDIQQNCFDYALTYNNIDGIKFHLPALMAASLENKGNTLEISVYF